MNPWIIYFFPFAFDIIVSISLFAARHALAERGMDTRTVGSILGIYGLGYIVANLFMGRIIRPAHARRQMIAGVLAAMALLLLLANTQEVRFIQMLFCGLPLASALFFNAFQSFMLGVDYAIAKPLTQTIAHYTCAWSLGFALGPAVAALLKTNLGWAASYYAAAATAAAIGVVTLLFQAPAAARAAAPAAAHGPSGLKSRSVSAWIGILVAWTGWNVMVTYWPVQAQQLGLSTHIKGLVEFSFALTQALAALALAWMPAQYYLSHRPAVLALCGAAGAILFAASTHAVWFVLGAALFGLYTSNLLCNMMFHATLEPDKSVKRVAVNEVCMGATFLGAPVLATLIRSVTSSFGAAYLCLAGLLVVGGAVQALAAGPTAGARVQSGVDAEAARPK